MLRRKHDPEKQAQLDREAEKLYNELMAIKSQSLKMVEKKELFQSKLDEYTASVIYHMSTHYLDFPVVRTSRRERLINPIVEFLLTQDRWNKIVNP